MKKNPKIIKASQLREHISRMIMEQGAPDEALEKLNEKIEAAARDIINAKSHNETGHAVEVLEGLIEAWRSARKA